MDRRSITIQQSSFLGFATIKKELKFFHFSLKITIYTIIIMATTLGYSYYTPIASTVQYEVFSKYIEHVYLQDITEEVAEKMSAIEQQIINSSAYKSQGIKQPHQNKWQVYKIANKTPLSELCLILNKMNNNNIDGLISEAVKYDTLSYVDIKQVADFLLGKCIKESNNIEIYCQFFKKAVSAGLWYVYHEEKVVSFLDICLDQLEHNYKDLTKIAGYIEDMYETQRSTTEEIVNGVVILSIRHPPPVASGMTGRVG